MRFLHTGLLALTALAQVAICARLEKRDASALGAATVQTGLPVAAPRAAAVDDAVDDTFTIFNGQRVPPLKELGGESLAEQLKNGYTFVKFYSPGCPHCIHVAPIFQTLYEFYWTSKPLASSSAGEQQSMNDFHHYFGGFDFAAVNCQAYGDTCANYDIHGYPTFILFKEGEIVKKFTGAKDMAGLSQFVEENLETIRPGSRVKGGPKLPAPGDKSAPDFDPAAVAAAVVAASKPTKNTKKTSSMTKPKLAKPVSTPNPAGSSISLTSESFQNMVTMSQEPWFIKFHVPWCHHCQAVAPIWTQIGKEMKSKLNIGEVDCEAEQRLCKDAHVSGFPTFLYFRGGERVEYQGLRGLGDFIAYANKAIEIEGGVPDVDLTEFKAMEATEDVIFVYFYDHATTSEDFIALERLTLSLIGHAKLVKTNSTAMAERFKITTWPRLLVSRDGRPTYYTALSPRDMRDFRAVLNWMQSVWLPIVPELTASNAHEIMTGKLVVLGVLTRDRPDEFMIAKKEIKSAALEWMDKQTQLFQLERQELRDAKQLRIEEAEDRNDQRALRAAKQIRISMDQSDRKEVGFAWVDGVFWERWIRTTFGIEVSDGERVIINDEDNKQYWDTTITGNYIIPSRTSILETIPKVVSTPPKIKPKFTVSKVEKLIFDIRGVGAEHSYLTMGLLILLILTGLHFGRRRMRRNRAGFFRLDEKNGLLGGNGNGKAD